MKPLIYLEIRLLANSIRNTLRSPRRLIPVVIVAAWLGAIVLENIMFLTGLSKPVGPLEYMLRPIESLPAIWSSIFVLLTIVACGIIYSALSEGLLVFAPSQMDFLFPSPIKRRHVLILKLLRDYTKYAAYAAFFFAMIGSPLYHLLNVRLFPEMFVAWGGTILLIILVMNLTHTLNVITTSGVHRMVFARLLINALILALILVTLSTALLAYANTEELVPSLIAGVRSSFTNIVLAPIAWATDCILVLFNGVVYQTWVKLLWLLLLATGSTALLLARPEDIYEPSLGVSTRMAQLRKAIASGDMVSARIYARGSRTNHRHMASAIPPFGRGASALLWKNLVIRIRTFGIGVVLTILLPTVTIAVVAYALPEHPVRRFLPLALPYLAWILALIGQQEMRGEMRHANITKAMPVSAFRTMAVQVFYEWMIVAVVLGIASVSIWYLIPDVEADYLMLALAMSLSFGFSCIAALSIPVLMYPDARDRMQDVIIHLVSFILGGMVITPTFVIVGLGEVLKAPAAATAIIVVVVNIAISLLALTISGAMFAKYDPTAE